MIRVNSVSPCNTYFDGGFWQSAEKNLPDIFKQALSLNPTGRMARPEEIGRGIVFLASPASSFTTGTNLVIDGAFILGAFSSSLSSRTEPTRPPVKGTPSTRRG